MEIVRVHPKGFTFLFCLYHGAAAVGSLLIAGFLLKLIPHDAVFFVGVLMITIPFLLVPPELLILIRDRKIIFRHRIKHSVVPFSDISLIETSARSVEIKNHDNSTLLRIDKKHFRNIDLSELAEYIRDLMSDCPNVDPMRYTSIRFTGCKFFGGCKSVLGKIF